MKLPPKKFALSVVLAGLAVAAPLHAAPTHFTPPASPHADAGPAVGEKAEIVSAKTEFAGTVCKMDVVIGLITVEHWPLSRTFKVPPECQIDILTNANAVLAELKVGEAVVVTYSEAGKDLVASRIVRQGKEYEQERKEKMERLDEMLNPSPNQ